MARGGRVIYKKAINGKNQKARSKHDDDEDEEYVLEEDEGEESESNFESDVNSRDLSDEESFEFCESDRSDNDEDEDEDEKEFTIAKSKKQGNRKKSRVSDDEMDADYELDDEEEEEVVKIVRSKKKRRNLKKSTVSDDEMDSDYELDDEGKEKGFKISKSKKKRGNRKKSSVFNDEIESGYELNDEEEDKEIKTVRSKKKPRNLKKSRASDDEMNSEYESDGEKEEKQFKIAKPKKTSSVSDDEMDANYELDDEEEEKEFEIERSKKQKGGHYKNTLFDGKMEDLFVPKRRRGGRRKKVTSDSDYELDDKDEEMQLKISGSKKKQGNHMNSRVFDEENEEKELTIARPKKNEGNRKKSTDLNVKMEDISVPKRRRKQNSRDSDYELGDEDDEDFSPDEDDFDDDEISVALKQTVKVSKMNGRKKKRRNGMTKSSDDDFIVKDRASAGRKRKRIKNTRKRSSEVDLESLDLDLAFLTSDDDFVEKDIARINNRIKNNKKVKKGAGRRKKRSLEGSESSDSDFVISDDDVEDDDDFDMKDQVALDNQEMNRKKEKVNESNRRKRRKRTMVDSESSYSDYLLSEDDEDFIVEEDHIVTDRQQKKSKKLRKKISRSSVDSDSESFEFDVAISEEEVRDLRIGGVLNHEKPKRVIEGKKVEEKGKEKKDDDSGKQVCGICLSEEKKSVVQGLLNCCTHYFCFACIMEWSKVESRCPLCKRRFAMISKLGRSNPGFGMRSSVIRVEKRDQVYQPSEEELRGMLDPYENVVCMECQQGGDDNLMLLCDTCDSSAHTYCVGLGREVPEGNWYCECCRSVSHGPTNSQFQDTMLNQETSYSNLLSSMTERSGFNSTQGNMNSFRPSSLRIDLNASPRDFPVEDPFVSTPTSGSGASTVSGRRHIRQRIHVILSNNRQRQTDAEATTSMNHNPLALSFEQRQQNPRPFFSTRINLAPCMLNEGSSIRQVDHAKEEVQHSVKGHLKNLSQNRILDRSTFKEIARTSTHTILAACGIEHKRSMVSTAVEPPGDCVHDSNDGPSHLLKGCCSSCFDSFVKDVVQQKLDDTTF